MADTPIDDRTFTEDEVREILKRAVRQSPSRRLSRRDGLSLEELKAIGAEAGIDEASMEAAAREVVLRRETGVNPLAGAPTLLSVERNVDGEIAPEDTPNVLSVIRTVMGQQGEIREIHGTLEWSVRGESGERHVTVWSRDGRTTIRAGSNLNSTVALTFLPTGILSLVGSLASLAVLLKEGHVLPLIIVLAFITVLFPTLRAILGHVSKAESEKLERVADELARLAREPTE